MRLRRSRTAAAHRQAPDAPRAPTAAAAPALFTFNGHQVRVLEVDGEPWFVAADVARLLGYTDPQQAVRDHCKGASKRRTLTAGGPQAITTIPERDLYRLIMRSKLPAAEQFEEWVVGEVLPAIRKTGGYVAAKQDDTPEEIMARAVLVGRSEAADALDSAVPFVVCSRSCPTMPHRRSPRRRSAARSSRRGLRKNSRST